MFNTSINHLLQSLDNPIVFWILNIISILGSLYCIIFILFALIGGVDFRKGFLVAYIFGWTILLTIFLKDYFDYPRPLAVDNTLKGFGVEKVANNLGPLQPSGFFELFSKELLSKTRESEIERTGFPSGHTSSQVAIWIGLALLIRKRWLWVFSISFVVLTMISRLFLAKHYLGDVSGGLVLGLSIVGVIYYLIHRLKLEASDHMNRAQAIFFALPLILLLFYKYLPAFQTGSTIGLSLAYLFIVYKWGNPILSSSLPKKVLNVLIYFLIFVSFYFLGKSIPIPSENFLAFILFTLLGFLSILMSTLISKKLRLMEMKG
jgi:membrane-associated phospholipid phosphatase